MPPVASGSGQRKSASPSSKTADTFSGAGTDSGSSASSSVIVTAASLLDESIRYALSVLMPTVTALFGSSSESPSVVTE